jgi:hypothetical protein
MLDDLEGSFERGDLDALFVAFLAAVIKGYLGVKGNAP